VFGHDWQSGEGRVVEIVDTGAGVGGGNRATVHQHFVIDVTPDSGDSFRCEVPALLRDSFRSPEAGDVVQLKCDPGRKQARFDPSDPMVDRKGHAAILRAERETAQARYDAEPGGDAPMASGESGSVRRV
jgi:hypothetical protein